MWQLAEFAKSRVIVVVRDTPGPLLTVGQTTWERRSGHSGLAQHIAGSIVANRLTRRGFFGAFEEQIEKTLVKPSH
ncbi:hypothetical protein [Roseinatronobacter sp. S2]|uniref:hypothetical protein n=1 Tax=Roseinatronobacter sp. S2 TaxID=3035471 RepID=UPI00240FF376|nr:hypothetical protein [Roseinatronobacter sp. S2]WFE75761.1 hypothetical protein P8S53_04955 [Roseinatronobacter sp. S2]